MPNLDIAKVFPEVNDNESHLEHGSAYPAVRWILIISFVRVSQLFKKEKKKRKEGILEPSIRGHWISIYILSPTSKNCDFKFLNSTHTISPYSRSRFKVSSTTRKHTNRLVNVQCNARV